MTYIEFNTQLVHHTPLLKGYAMLFTKDKDEAGDLVQDTLLKALSYYDKFVEGTNLKGWLYTIMKNTFINNYRKFSKIKNVISQMDELLSPNLLFSSTKNGSENKFAQRDINIALSQLNKDYSTPFMMYFEGYKYHEIAEMLNIPIGTVKTRIHVARKQLKSKLSDYEYKLD